MSRITTVVQTRVNNLRFDHAVGYGALLYADREMSALEVKSSEGIRREVINSEIATWQP